jgi:hypothetical protein
MSAAEIEPSPEPGTIWVRWPADLAQQGEPAYFPIARLGRPEYQEALARARRKHGVRVSRPERRPPNLVRATIDAMSETAIDCATGTVSARVFSVLAPGSVQDRG